MLTSISSFLGSDANLIRRVKLLEEEHRGGIDLSQFYVKPEDQNNAGK